MTEPITPKEFANKKEILNLCDKYVTDINENILLNSSQTYTEPDELYMTDRKGYAIRTMAFQLALQKFKKNGWEIRVDLATDKLNEGRKTYFFQAV